MSHKDGDQMTTMEAWQKQVLGGWCTVQPMARSMEEVATFIPAEMLLKP